MMDLGLTYTKIGDYYYPDITLPDSTEYHIGRYGRMHMRYLKEHRPVIWGQLSLSGELPKHLFEIDTVTEALKAADPMAWVGWMNNICSRAEEIVLHDLVYAY